MTLRDDLQRISAVLAAATTLMARFTPGAVQVERKAGGDPVTEADRVVNDLLRARLPQADDGWLSEESVDDRTRLGARRVWVVDPLDGTKEFVTGLPEWCVSVGLVIDGQPVAGGISNPATGETIVGAVGCGVTLNGAPTTLRTTTRLDDAEILASRSEHDRGEWQRFATCAPKTRPCGSVAYKLALVAAGRADATWTLVPKHEWDVAAGVALLVAAGASVWLPGDATLRFNQPSPKLPGLIAATPAIAAAVRDAVA